jgi:predicted membrane protein
MEQETKSTGRGSASFFWPVILIGVGVIALLVNAGRLEVHNLWGLLNLWPLLLVLAGIDLIFSRHLPALGGLLALALLGVVIWVLLQGGVPALAREHIAIGDLRIHTSPAEMTRDRYTEQRNGAESLVVDLDLSSFRTDIRSLPAGRTELFDATIDHFGPMRFDVSGQGQRHIVLGPQSSYLNVAAYSQGSYRWNIGLAEDVDLDLAVDVGSGDVTMDLTRLTLTTLAVDGGSGNVDILLPQQAYALSFDGGSGSLALDVAASSVASLTLETGSGDVQVVIGPGADTALELGNGGSGDLSILVPRTAAVRVEVKNSGSGAVQLPRDLARQHGQDKVGLWESEGYASASHKINIVAGNLGSGDLTVSYR